MLAGVKTVYAGLHSRLTPGQQDLSYIIEPANWAIRSVSQQLSRALQQSTTLTSNLTTTHWGLRNQLVHFASLNTLLTTDHWRQPHRSNRTIVTIYHLSPVSRQTYLLPRVASHLDAIHTTNQQTRHQLIKLGLPEAKIKVIPLGVNPEIFKPASPNQRQALRRSLDIPDQAFVIGSFQKDGVGWDSGFEPKLIKGPDLLIKVAKQLSRHHPIHLLLAGPARGYVTEDLARHNIPFTNLGYLPDLTAVAKYYGVLDAYLITSRVEGGPQQLLEAWASGVPVVATKVGLVPDIAVNHQTALLADVEDIPRLTKHVAGLITNPDATMNLVTQAGQHVSNYTWANIAQRYYQVLYQPLL